MFFRSIMNRNMPPNPPGMRLLYPNRPPGPRNPYIPTQVSPPLDTTGRLGSIGDSPFANQIAPRSISDLPMTEMGASLRATPELSGRTTPELMGIGDRASGQPAESTFNNLLNTTQGAMGGSSQGDAGGSAPMSNPFMGGSPFGFSIDQSMIDRIREIIRQRQQQMAQPSSQPPQIDPAAIQARLDEFLTNNPDRASISLPFGGNIDIANLRDRMARLSALMGRGMSFQEAMGNQRAAIAQGHDLNNDGIVTDAEYRQSTMPAPTGEFATNPASGTPMIEERISQLMNAVGGGRI